MVRRHVFALCILVLLVLSSIGITSTQVQASEPPCCQEVQRWYKTYYSNATYSSTVGITMYDCDGYITTSGTTSAYYKTTYFYCP